jgi:hypothetical protein
MATNKTQNEPQSYGSQGEWVSGRTGGTVEGRSQKGTAPDASIYDSRHTSERSPGAQGGEISPVDLARNAQPTGRAQVIDEEDMTPRKVTSHREGAKHDSYFRERDYAEKG